MERNGGAKIGQILGPVSDYYGWFFEIKPCSGFVSVFSDMFSFTAWRLRKNGAKNYEGVEVGHLSGRKLHAKREGL